MGGILGTKNGQMAPTMAEPQYTVIVYLGVFSGMMSSALETQKKVSTK